MTPLELQTVLELTELDDDLRKVFEAVGVGGFVGGFPTQIQMNRLLRQLVEQIKQSNQCGQGSCYGQNNVEPKDFPR